MITLVTMIIFVSKTCVVVSAGVDFNYPMPEPYQKHLFSVFERYLEPGQMNFCIDCDELIHLIPRKVALVTINRKDKIINWPSYNKVDTYIIDLTIETMEKLEFIQKTPGWNPRAKFFVVYRKKSTNYLLKLLFSKYIVNVAIFSNPDNTTLTIRSYDPFQNGELHPKTLKAITIGIITETNKEIYLQLDLFPNKYPRHWNNITINVLPVIAPPYIMIIPNIGVVGLDYLYLKTVGKRMGIKFIYSSKDTMDCWGEKGSDGKYSFAFGALQSQKFGISAGAFQLSYPEYADFDMVYPVMEDYLVMVVPAAPIKERSKCIIDIFQKPVWISLIVSLLLMSIVFFFKSTNSTKYELSISFLICLACFLKITISKMPKYRSQRYLFLFWFIYCFMIDSYFESHLQGVFNVAHREKQIDSFEEIKNTGMKIAINKRNLKLFNNNTTEIDRFIFDNHFETNSPIEALNKSINNINKSAVIVLERFIKYSTALFYVDSEDGSSTVHIVTEKLMFYPLTVYFTKGFPLFDDIQRLLHEFKAIGFIEKLYRYDQHMVKLFSYRKGIKWKIAPINLADLKYVLWLILGGFVFSTSILVFEIIWNFITLSGDQNYSYS